MRYVILFIAILFFGVGNLLFAVPNQIMNGGMTGLSLMSYYIFKMNIGLSLFLFNLPLFLFAFFRYRDLFYKSIISMTCLSIIVGILQNDLISYGIKNIWIGSIVGGFWMGLSLGILVKMNASLGGGSLLGRMLHLRYGFSLSKTIFFIDCTVYPLSLFVIGGRETLFSMVLTASSSLGIYVVSVVYEKMASKERNSLAA
ncbi:YitT family protein [Ammoniphilus sp. 3BR4]|uniref:YitT family protein n=1 Tax=Ammoniphilus sp. 3BR4 TaxID=3158265 RepID=UPI0034664656